MAILDNVRQERFAQELATGRSATDSYEFAGYKRDDGHASRLAGQGKIRGRVHELKQEAARMADIRRQDIIELLRADHDLARERGQMAAAIRAAELLGKSIGMFGDQPEIDPIAEEAKNMTPAQMRERIVEILDSINMPEVADRYRAGAVSVPAKD
jgi:phage terminase small subunit